MIRVRLSATSTGKKGEAMPRTTDTITFSLPPETAQRVREVVREEQRTVSELLREAIRLYMEEREWRIQERMQRRLSSQVEQD